MRKNITWITLILFLCCFVCADNLFIKDQKQKLKEFQLTLKNIPTENRIVELKNYHDSLHQQRLKEIKRVLNENKELSVEKKAEKLKVYNDKYKLDKLAVEGLWADTKITEKEKEKQTKRYINKQYERFYETLGVIKVEKK